jgi:hypothetical protein
MMQPAASRSPSSCVPARGTSLSRFSHPAAFGRQVCCGCRQSIPSSRWPSWAAEIETMPSAGDGQINRPRSSRLA